MPQRFLRPGITTSDRWNACSWKAQSLYIRIMTLVDDYGRYDGRLPILHAHCFPLRNDIKPQETAALVDELSKEGLVELYKVDGKDYLQMLKWQERTRGNSKYPDPNDGQILRNPAESCAPQAKDASLAISHKPSPLPDGFEQFWVEYPKKKAKADARKAFLKALKLTTAEALMEALRNLKVSNDWVKEGGKWIPYPASWLNAEGWHDEVKVESPKPKMTAEGYEMSSHSSFGGVK